MSPRRETVRSFCQWTGIAAVVALGTLPALVYRTNGDIAWLVYAARRVTEGATLYVDLIEINPPLIVWISFPAIWVADLTGISEMLAFLLLVSGLAVVSLLLVYRVLRSADLGLSPDRLRGIVAMLAIVAVGLSGSVFGQREHLMLLATAPYAAVVGVRVLGGRVSRGTGIGVGLLAAIGFAVKPHFYLLWLGLEVFLHLKRRTARAFRSEVVCVLLFGSLYAASVPLLTPEYFTVVDRLGALYAGHRQTSLLEITVNPVTLGLAAALLYRRLIVVSQPTDTLVQVSAVCAGSLLVVVAVQGQGFYYHYYPVMAWVLLLMGLELWGREGGGWRDRVPWWAVAAMLGWLVVLAVSGSFASLDRQEFDRRTSAVADHLRRAASEDPFTVAVLTPQHRTAYPLVNRAGARSVLGFNGLWPATVLCDSACRATRSYLDGTIRPGSEAEAFFRETMIRDLTEEPADFLLFDESEIRKTFPDHPFNYIAYFASDSTVRATLAGYLCGERMEGYLICRRRPSDSADDAGSGRT